jgi:hypothetical protein
MRPEIEKKMEKMRNSRDACLLIVELTTRYNEPTGSPFDRFIHELRKIALMGVEKSSVVRKGNLIPRWRKEAGNGKVSGRN